MSYSRRCDELGRRSRSCWSWPDNAYRQARGDITEQRHCSTALRCAALHDAERPMLGGGGVREVCLVDQISSRWPAFPNGWRIAHHLSQAVSVVAAFQKNEERRSSRSLTGDFLSRHDIPRPVLRVMAKRRGRLAAAGRHSAGIRGACG